MKHTASAAGMATAALLMMMAAVAAAVAWPASASGQKEEGGGISGRYVDGAAGFQIDLPDGWEGSRAFSYPIVSPESFSGWPSVTMSIMTFDTRSAKVLWQDPNFKKSELDACKELARNYVTINKMRVSEVIKVCENDSFARTKTYSFATRDNIILVTLNANSTASYDRHITEFEKSVSSVKIAKPADLRTLVRDLSGQHTAVYKVTAPGSGGKQQMVDVKVDSTSTVKNLQMKDRRTVSFEVEGRNGTRGVTEMSIGALMKGPYEVRIDGAATKEVKKTEDRTTGETLLSINYSHGSKHKVTITSIKKW